ncbi:hypothetical protein BHE74_00023565 [Ensete ventricosum]|nr:hypothetical protein GW17_00015078 [Ensete ventricosum]RWW68869.1 hypothetical protein BHE74_00023565 [Ensete ventricosum]RZR95016.1 hypothetical protein BHM03_00023797 [Ensete ventricosum]
MCGWAVTGQRSPARAAAAGSGRWRQWRGGQTTMRLATEVAVACVGKTAATREEKEAGVSGGWQRWLVTGLGRYVRWLAVAADGLRARGKRPEQQGCVGGLRQRVEAAVAGEAAMRAGNRGGDGLCGEDGQGQRRSVGEGYGRVDIWGSYYGRGDGDMVGDGSSREERNRGGRRRKRRPRERGIWWPAAAAGRRGIEVAGGGRGQRRCAAAAVGEEERRWWPATVKGGPMMNPLYPRMRTDFLDGKKETRLGRLLMIEPIEVKDLEHEEEDFDHEEEDTEEESQLVDCMMHALASYANPQTMKVGGLLKHQPITILDIGSTNNFMNCKVATHMTLHIEDCSKFDVKVIDHRILKCNRRCPRVKLLLQDQEIITDFFLLPLDDYEAVLSIKWMTTLGDVS